MTMPPVVPGAVTLPVIPSAARDLLFPGLDDRDPAARQGIASILAPAHQPSPSQREAIEAAAAPMLVLAGPGAGKTFCLIERIRFLIEQIGLAPERLCAFTFT